ncbi:hypothetical protein PGTUg99_000822 [Puccinia graminis f. sp. tritici]|uniref:Uncharacterized protein n=1 Tax=Puccinia graminis f. sp. tritici TaxID=56615 RepID=A0A5B0RPU9_PUCGR|nr:hypothetical protein PGTUg99_000822 [Puccinia graminis f. sp. tritici]
MLDYDGVHFQLWHDTLDRTLMHFFMKHASFLRTVTNFDGLSIDKNLSITRIIRNTIESGLIGIVNGSKLTAPLELYNLLKKNCFKIGPTTQGQSHQPPHGVGNRHVSSRRWKKSAVSYSKLLSPPPAGVNVKTFEFSVDSQLNAYKRPVFADVSSIIQAATGKLKAKSLSSGPIPMDLDQLQAMQPLKLPTTKAKASLKPSSIGTAMHVAIAKRKATAPPPRQSDNNRLRQVNIPNMTNGCLLDSGASAHNIKQALAVPDAALWRAAAEYEMLSLDNLKSGYLWLH